MCDGTTASQPPFRLNRPFGRCDRARITRAMTLFEPADTPPQATATVGFVSCEAEDAVARHLLRPLLLPDREIVILAGFDNYGRLAGLETVEGDRSGRCVIPPDSWRNLLGRDIGTILMAHNHPSGQARPSDADLRCTHQALQFLRLIGIELTDHLIFVESGHFSFCRAHLI